MPVLQSSSPISPPATAQLNLQGMAREVLSWNPDLTELLAVRFVQNAYRKILDRRLWSGGLVAGQLAVPSAYSTGTVTLTNGSAIAQGTGTAFTAAMVGLQFRVGFSLPTMNILSVNIGSQQITFDLPWGAQNFTSTGFQIFQQYASFGANVKMLLAVVNKQMGYRMQLHVPQEVLNAYDTWRTNVGWTWAIGDYVPTSDGQPQFELYPIPFFQQVFPFLAYSQPTDLMKDGDAPTWGVRSDVIVMDAISQALLFRGKNSKYYDPNTAMVKKKEFEQELANMMNMDNNIVQRNLIWEYEKYPMTTFDADWKQSHDM